MNLTFLVSLSWASILNDICRMYTNDLVNSIESGNLIWPSLPPSSLAQGSRVSCAKSETLCNVYTLVSDPGLLIPPQYNMDWKSTKRIQLQYKIYDVTPKLTDVQNDRYIFWLLLRLTAPPLPSPLFLYQRSTCSSIQPLHCLAVP